VGLDAGLFAQEEMTGVMAVSCTSLSGGEEGLASLAVMRACNSLAASGAKPEAVSVQLVLSESTEEKELKAIMERWNPGDVALIPTEQYDTTDTQKILEEIVFVNGNNN
jgi:hydrogenase maturation factor